MPGFVAFAAPLDTASTSLRPTRDANELFSSAFDFPLLRSVAVTFLSVVDLPGNSKDASAGVNGAFNVFVSVCVD